MHRIKEPALIYEFDEEKKITFHEYMATKPQWFSEKIYPFIGKYDKALIKDALKAINKLAVKIPEKVESTMLHKDIFEDNLLEQDGKLSGVVDWDASLTGPKEWEFAILRQRIPKWWDLIKSYSDKELNEDILNCCGLAQSLRFWKAYPEQEDFVEKQRSYIKEILG